MIKVEINEDTISLETGGSVLDIACETLEMINAIYFKIRQREPGLAAAFQALVESGVSDPDAPTWTSEAPAGDVDVAVFIPKPKKGGDKP